MAGTQCQRHQIGVVLNKPLPHHRKEVQARAGDDRTTRNAVFKQDGIYHRALFIISSEKVGEAGILSEVLDYQLATMGNGKGRHGPDPQKEWLHLQVTFERGGSSSRKFVKSSHRLPVRRGSTYRHRYRDTLLIDVQVREHLL